MTRLLALLMSVSMLLAMIGCGTPARRVDPGGPEAITTVDDLDTQDASDAAGQLAESLLNSGVLGRNGQPSVIAISRYVNNTSRQIDRDRVVKKIRVTLNKAGVAQTMTTIDSTGEYGGEDPIAVKAAKQRNPDAPLPEYSLTFKLLEQQAKAGDIRQVTYIFQMSLTDVETGVAVWEEEKRIAKQGSKATVGW